MIIQADIVILKPLFKINGREPGFGINEAKFKGKNELLVYTSYRRVDGSIWNPYIYSVTKEVAFSCPSKPAKAGVHLRMVPLSLMRMVGKWAKAEPPRQPKLFPDEGRSK